MPKIPAFLTAALLAAAGFASTAEAHGLGFHSPMFFRDEGPMEMEPPHHHCQAREDREFAMEQERQRELAEMRAEQAAGAAQKAAAAKRARMLATRKEEAREAARQEARQEVREEAARQAEADAAAKAQQIQQPVQAPNAIAQKGDLLPTAPATPEPATTSTASAETTTAAVSEPASAASSDQQTCRKYSAATDGLIDTPCQ